MPKRCDREFAELLEALRGRAEYLLRLYGRRQNLGVTAEDLVSEAVTRLLETERSGTAVLNPVAWCGRVMHSFLMDKSRDKNSRAQPLLGLQGDEARLRHLIGVDEDPDPDPDQTLAERFERIRDLLAMAHWS